MFILFLLTSAFLCVAAAHTRPRVVDVLARRGARLRGPRTWNDENQTCEARIASERPAVVFDVEREELVDEILLMSGFMCAAQSVPLLDDHDPTNRSTIGRVTNFRIVGDGLEATLHFTVDCPTRDKVADGTIDACSVGYRVHEYVTIEPCQTAYIEGAHFTAQERPLRVVASWELMENSIVPVGADSSARIRSQSFEASSEGRKMSVAIHLKSSVSGRLSAREAAACLALRSGIDPSQNLAEINSRAGCLDRVNEAAAIRAAEVADRNRHLPLRTILGRALEASGHRVVDHTPAGLGRAMYLQQRDGWGGSQIAELFDVTAATMVFAGANQVLDTTSPWCDDSDILNYQPWPSLQLSTGELSEVPKGGAASMIDVEVVGGNVQIARFGARAKIGEEYLTNAVAGGAPGMLPKLVLQGLGQAAKSMEINLPWLSLIDPPVSHDGLPTFHAEHGNLLPSSNFDEPALADAWAMLASQERNGVRLNFRPAALLTPTELEIEGRKLVQTIELAGDRSTPTPAVIGEPRLSLGIKHPKTGELVEGDANTWYLAAAAPGYGVQRQFLAGLNRMPQIRTFPLASGSGEWGLQIDIAHSVGSSLLSWESLVKVIPAST